MIYLIESFIRSGDDHPLRCLKIGYAKDINDRMKAYKTYNPSIKLLKTREGEYDLENYLHKYFKRYELSDFNEWFIYSKKIIEEFEFVDIQEETITIDEYLEYVRKEILRIIPKIYESLYMKIPKLLEELEKEFNINSYGEEIYSEFPKDLCKERIKFILKFLERKEVEYFSSTDFSDIRMDFPQIMGRQRLKENKFKDECIFIYKLSDETVTMEEYDRISKEKLRRSQVDLNSFRAVREDSLTDSENLARMMYDLRLRIKTDRYSGDYTGIQERTGTPVINKLVMISERRAFELRSNTYKSDVQVYNEFATLSTKLSYEDFSKRDSEIKILRSIYKSSGTFESKMRSICDFLLNPKWFGHVHVSDLYWLPLTVRNYLIQLGPKRIKEIGCREGEIKKEILGIREDPRILKKDFTDLDSINSLLKIQFSKQFMIGQRYSLKDIKEIISKIYIFNNITKTPKATDLENYFNIRKCTINLKDGKRINGYEIISLKS